MGLFAVVTGLVALVFFGVIRPTVRDNRKAVVVRYSETCDVGHLPPGRAHS